MPNAINWSPSQGLFQVHDDFTSLNTVSTTGLWTDVNDGATGAIGTDATNPGGWLKLVTTATADDYHSLATNQKIFKIAKGKPISFDCKILLTEASTNKSQLFIGLSSVTTTAGMQAANAGPLATFDGCAFYKTGATSVLGFIASAGSTQSSIANIGAFTSGVAMQLSFEIADIDGTYANVQPYVNGVAYNVGNAQTSVKIAYGATGALLLMVGVIAGSTTAETLFVDYINCSQSR